MFSIPHDPQHQQINVAVALVESPLTGLLTCSLINVTPLHCPCAIGPSSHCATVVAVIDEFSLGWLEEQVNI